MQSDICLYSIPHFLSFLTSGNCMTRPSAMFMIHWLGLIYFIKQNRVLISRKPEKLLVCRRAKEEKENLATPGTRFCPCFLIVTLWQFIDTMWQFNGNTVISVSKVTIGLCWFPHTKPTARSLQLEFFPLTFGTLTYITKPHPLFRFIKSYLLLSDSPQIPLQRVSTLLVLHYINRKK